MAQNTSFMNMMSMTVTFAWIFTACCHSSTGHICRLSTKPTKHVLYGQDQICCNSTLYSKFDIQGRERHCCGNHLFYPDRNCGCVAGGKLKLLYPGSSLDLCLVTVSEPSQSDTTEMSPGLTEVPEKNGYQGCQNTDHRYCINAGTCFDPSKELCCPDGVFKEIVVCPSLDLNNKFCSNSERSEIKVCAKRYKYAYDISVGERIAQDGSSKTFRARARTIMPDGSRIRKRRLSKRFLNIKINVTTPYYCDIPGRTFTVFSTKRHKWKASSYIYLDKDDLVFSRKIRHKNLINICKKYKQSKRNQPFEVNRVSNSGHTQYFRVLTSVTLRFNFSLGVHFILNTFLYR